METERKFKLIKEIPFTTFKVGDLFKQLSNGHFYFIKDYGANTILLPENIVNLLPFDDEEYFINLKKGNGIFNVNDWVYYNIKHDRKLKCRVVETDYDKIVILNDKTTYTVSIIKKEELAKLKKISLYYYINSLGIICNDVINKNKNNEMIRKEIGNYFLSYDEANQYYIEVKPKMLRRI